MNENNFQPSQIDFSGVPALDDIQGLENFLNNESLRTLGIENTNTQPQSPQPTTEVQPQPTTQPGTTQQPTTTAPVQPTQPTTDQIQAILTNLDAINKRLNTPQPQPQQRTPAAPSPNDIPATKYTENEYRFIVDGLRKGYSLDIINQIIMSKRAGTGVNPQNSALERRLANIEESMRIQEYEQAKDEFVTKLSTFGEKWGLSEQDLITFGTQAMQQGINIAMPNINLELIFRAMYPEQYAIRTQRMTPSNTSQIYGGNSIPEGNRQQASRLEDAYVESFLKKSMPNYSDRK